MRKWLVKLFVLVAAVAGLGLPMQAYAWDNEQRALNDVLDTDACVTLIKREKDKNGNETEKVIPDAEFYLYDADGEQIGGKYLTDKNGEISVMLSAGKYYFKETKPAQGYTYDCDESGTAIKKYYFTLEKGVKNLTVLAYNRKSSSENITISGEKTWKLNGNDVSLPKRIVIKLLNGGDVVEKQTVYPDSKGKWKYEFNVPKYDSKGKRITYKVEEEPVDGFYATYSGYDILNTYVDSVEIDFPDIKKEVKGENVPREKFTFVLKGKKGSPMPSDASGTTYKLSRTGAGKLSFGNLVFDEVGEYVYTVYESDGGEHNWEYDPTEYTVTFNITKKNGKLSASYTIKKDGKKASSIVFTNKYEKVDLNQTVTVSGKKEWIHLNNPVENRPEEIIVYLYADGVLSKQKRCTADNNWEYSFVVPKYASDGKKIVYSIDEADVYGYSKKIDGYNITNSYSGEAVKPTETPDIPNTSPPTAPSGGEVINKPVDNPKTGDDFNLKFWAAAALVGLIGLIIMIIILIKNRAYKGRHMIEKGSHIFEKNNKKPSK